MRSVRRMSAACVATLPVAVLLTGCVSTQRIAARARLVSARELASQSTTEVARANADVTVARLTLIHTRTGTAVVASLRNNSSSTLTDLPISVGIHAKHAVYLNRAANLDYFDSHIAAIAPRSVTTWVFTTRRSVPGGRPFATVGASQLHSSAGARLPQIDVSLRAGRPAPGRAAVAVSVSNRSGIPQYDVQVYAVAIRGGRDVGAGRSAVTHLGTNATTTLSITLLGGTQRAALRLIALPTIFS